jgi:hypothetical protein
MLGVYAFVRTYHVVMLTTIKMMITTRAKLKSALRCGRVLRELPVDERGEETKHVKQRGQHEDGTSARACDKRHRGSERRREGHAAIHHEIGITVRVLGTHDGFACNVRVWAVHQVFLPEHAFPPSTETMEYLAITWAQALVLVLVGVWEVVLVPDIAGAWALVLDLAVVIALADDPQV